MMAQSIRDGLLDLHSALDRMAKEPQDLEKDRERFNRSPSPIPSPKSLSGTTTQSGSPGPDSTDTLPQAEHREKILGFINTHYNSCPSKQFSDLVEDEKVHIRISDYRRVWIGEAKTRTRIMYDTEHDELAKERVKQQWIEQGIWREGWSYANSQRPYVDGGWKHEMALSEVEDEECTDYGPLFPLPNARPKRPIEQVRHDCEASRPLPMFLYQVSLERKRILECRRAVARERALAKRSRVEDAQTKALYNPGDTALAEEAIAILKAAKLAEAVEDSVDAETEADHIDLNSIAYARVRSAWIRRNIWMDEWIALPGRSWRHEYMVTDFLDGSDLEDFLEDQRWETKMQGQKTRDLKRFEERRGLPTRGLIPAKYRKPATKPLSQVQVWDMNYPMYR